MDGTQPPQSQRAAYAQAFYTRTQYWVSLPVEERRNLVKLALEKGSHEVVWSAMEAYLAIHNSAGYKMSHKTIANYRYCFFKFIRFMENSGFEIISPKHNLGNIYKLHLMSTDVKAHGDASVFNLATVRLHIGAIRHFYRFLQWNSIINHNPFEKTRVPKSPGDPWDRRNGYSSDEVRALLSCSNEENRLIILLGAHAGLRINEIRNIQVKDFDIQNSTLLVTEGKGGSPRAVNLNRETIKAVIPLLNKPDYIIGKSYGVLRRQLIKLCKFCNVNYRGFHALRHYCGSKLYSITHDLESVSQHLGHKSLETTRVYAKPSADAIRNELTKW